ncbi:MAG: hypothetical protein WA806_14490, partial [Bradyrhizobium sp.]
KYAAPVRRTVFRHQKARPSSARSTDSSVVIRASQIGKCSHDAKATLSHSGRDRGKSSPAFGIDHSMTH